MHAVHDGYRADVDGLRAVAVAAVIAFHAFPERLPGGYVGVDVFFVISGYLISKQLIAEAAGGGISFAGFYARRIRRIFPALIIVLLSVAIAGWWLLLPDEWVQLRRHLGASAIFANNVVLWSESGYFDTDAELKPLLHLWSLGVEEQFYLIWPLWIWCCWRWFRRRFAAIAAIVAISFAINVWTVNRGDVSAAFFLPHTRLWQLAAGALLASLAREGRPLSFRGANAMSVVGMALIVIAFTTLSRAVAYPGWPAVVPTLGAALVIAAGSGAVVNRSWLAARVMVFVGVISYPLYLWHWPILSFLQITEQGNVSPRLKVVAIAASVLLATITYRLIERPVRRALTPATLPQMEPVWIPLAAIGLAMEVMITTGWPSPQARTALQTDQRVRVDLNSDLCRKRFPGLGEYCQQFHRDWPVTTAVLGDSHAAHFLPGLGALLRAKGETVVHLGQTGCPPLIGIERVGEDGDNTCTRVNQAMLASVLADASINCVWLSFRGARAVEGGDIGDTRRELFRVSGSTTTNRDAIRDGLRATIGLLQKGGKRVGVMLQVPELGFRVDECTGRPISLAHAAARVPCRISRAAVLERQAGYRRIVSDMQREFGISVYDPLLALCDEDACGAVADGRVLYVDDNHLGVFGSSVALRRFDSAGE
ncbi:MAG TPA: acyltransferase family protein [Vicinamibacterales bacterium]|nr:acyltransferase family protein [Vicinamibacterales bacterium]